LGGGENWRGGNPRPRFGRAMDPEPREELGPRPAPGRGRSGRGATRGGNGRGPWSPQNGGGSGGAVSSAIRPGAGDINHPRNSGPPNGEDSAVQGAGARKKGRGPDRGGSRSYPRGAGTRPYRNIAAVRGPGRAPSGGPQNKHTWLVGWDHGPRGQEKTHPRPFTPARQHGPRSGGRGGLGRNDFFPGRSGRAGTPGFSRPGGSEAGGHGRGVPRHLAELGGAWWRAMGGARRGQTARGLSRNGHGGTKPGVVTWNRERV